MRCNQELYGHINCDRDVIQGEKFCKFHFAPSLRIEIAKLEDKIKDLEYEQVRHIEILTEEFGDKIKELEAQLAKAEGVIRSVLHFRNEQEAEIVEEKAREYFESKEVGK